MQQEALEQRFPIIESIGYISSGSRHVLAEDAARDQRADTLRRALEQVLECGVLSSDKQYRAAVEQVVAGWAEMLEALADA